MVVVPKLGLHVLCAHPACSSSPHLFCVQLAAPQVKFVIDRLEWLYTHRRLIGGLQWVEEPEILRFFYGRLAPIGNWQEALAAQFKKDFGCSL